MASATPLGRAHKQRLTLLTMFTHGVIVTLQTNIWFVNTSTVAVFVAAALRGAVIPYKAKVTLANSRGCACPIHTALCTHWLTLTRNTAKYVTLFAGAVVSLWQIVAVLSAVTVVMTVGAFILLWTMEKRPAAVCQRADTLTHTIKSSL